MVHELSHHLEADRETFNRAVAFLSRRTAGDMIEVINERGDLGRRDKFRNTKGRANAYPGRVYEATRSTDAEGWHRATLSGLPGHPRARGPGDRGDVDVQATEVLSVGMQWMWENPAGFAATDPEYFDFHLGYSGEGNPMIRLREAVTGAEAEWDRHKWSGDKRFVSRLRTQQEGVVPPSAVGRTVTACQDGGQYDQLVILAGFGCPPRP